jgi:hypothetical protein
MKRKAIIMSIVVVPVACSLFFGFRVWQILKGPDLTPRKLTLPEISGEFQLKKTPPLDNVHLLDDEFRILRRVSEIPSACMSTFESSFVTINDRPPRPGEFRLANPGEPFQWSDYIVKELPFRRLEFAGSGATGCFIQYQSGGQPSTFCLAVIHFSDDHKIWVGQFYEKPASNLEELRRMIAQRQLRDGRGC